MFDLKTRKNISRVTFTVIFAGAMLLGMTASVPAAVPPLPAPAAYPVQLVLDDDGAETSFSLAGASARQFMWFNSFSDPGPFRLEEIWVLFPNNADVLLGGDVQLVVCNDPDGDPTNGADLLGTYNVTIQAKDGNTFSVYPLAAPLDIPAAGTILIGVVNRYFITGVNPPPTAPASFDNTLSQNSSYAALWVGDAPDPPDLGTAVSIQLLAGVQSGNFMIRGFGTPIAVATIPALGPVGLASLTVMLACAGAFFLRRKSTPS